MSRSAKGKLVVNRAEQKIGGNAEAMPHNLVFRN